MSEETKSKGISFESSVILICFATMFVAKVFGVIDWSWGIVFMPLYIIPFGIFCIFLPIILFIALEALYKKIDKGK